VNFHRQPLDEHPELDQFRGQLGVKGRGFRAR
jgi:hypothetical protein